ncbi:GGDEF domain-containing protein [Aeromicrobium sp. UC242_57]|uniref:GGDEF domain-containing protein n=1 Tax=Aeromicrobium sp. UC242_57 TaxID=3374624 RepID=UPI0037A5F5A2
MTQVFDGAAGVATFVAVLDHPSGSRWFHVTARGIAHTTITPERAVCTIVDITDERREQQRHRHDAEHDPLTGLLNRRGARAVMDRVTDTAEGGLLVLVMAGDLDGFKTANDRFGHQVGDQVLTETAARLRQVMPPDASVIRLGGDEFLMLARCAEQSDAERLADAVVADMQRPFQIGDRRIAVSMSLGLITAEASGIESIGTLVDAADRALYEAKSAGRACWVSAGQ